MYKVISWHTPDYAGCSERLAASLEKHGYTNHVEYPMQPVGRWNDNILLKPQIIKQALVELDCDIVYLDADAVVNGPLDLFDRWTGEDFGAHFRMGRELLGGTLYLSNNPRVWAFLDAVAHAMAVATACGIGGMGASWQRNAQMLLCNLPDLTVKRIPVEYCTIFDGPDAVGVRSVVTHMQYSRQVAH